MTGKVIPLSDGFPERKPDQITTYDLLSTSTIGYRANPDTLVGRHGLTIYSKMANDEQVKAVLNFKRDAITARGWQFKFREGTPLSEDDQAARRRLFMEILARMRGSFADALNVIMTGRAYGFSITEKVYGELELDGKEWPAINMLMGRDPLSFRFYTDEYGVLEKVEQQTARAGVVAVDRKRVIHYVHAPEWDHVYGRSDLREAYRSWYIKDQISNVWPLYLERFAGGFIHASQAPDASLSVAELDALDDALKRAKSLGAIRTPPGITLSVIHPPSSPDMYERAIQFHDLAIAKALLVPNLLGISQAGGGSYAQSQTQLEAFFWTLNADATRLEECLNEQLFRDLGDQAWGDGEYPVFQFKPASVEHVKWVISTWAQMIAAGSVIPTEADEAFLRKLLELPARSEDDKPIAVAMQELQPQPPPGADLAALMGGGGGVPGEDVPEGEGEDLTLGALLGGEKPTPVGKGDLREFARADAKEDEDEDEDAAEGDLDLSGYREQKGKANKRVATRTFANSAESAAEVERIAAALKDAGYVAKRSNPSVNEAGGFGPGYSFVHPDTKRKIDVGASNTKGGWTVELDVFNQPGAEAAAMAKFIARQVRLALAAEELVDLWTVVVRKKPKDTFHLPGQHEQGDHDWRKTGGGAKDKDAVDLYHGTSSSAWASGIKKQGLLPGQMDGQGWAEEFGYSDTLFVAKSVDAASEYAEFAARRDGADAALIHIRMPRKDFEANFKRDKQGGFKASVAIPPKHIAAVKIYKPSGDTEDMARRARFHLPGQHEQADHAGGGGLTQGSVEHAQQEATHQAKVVEQLYASGAHGNTGLWTRRDLHPLGKNIDDIRREVLKPLASGELKTTEAIVSALKQLRSFLLPMAEHSQKAYDHKGAAGDVIKGIDAGLNALKKGKRATDFARRKRATGPTLYVAFPSAAALEAWLLKLRVGDGFLLADPYAVDTEPATAPEGGALLTVTLDAAAPLDLLPAGSRLTVTAKTANALEARYDGVAG